MKTRKTTTRFMNGNIDVDGEILDILTSEFGMAVIMECEVGFDDAIYSDGFVHAIESGLIPQIDTISKSFESKKRRRIPPRNLQRRMLCYLFQIKFQTQTIKTYNYDNFNCTTID
jgi:hypothetical protein